MRLEFIINVDGVEISVDAQSCIQHYSGLPHMQYVGGFSFTEVKSGKSLGQASRYYEDCDEIKLLASTQQELNLAHQALSWLEQNNGSAWEKMNWNTDAVGSPRDYQRDEQEEEEYEAEEEEEDSSIVDQSVQSIATPNRQKQQAYKSWNKNKSELKEINKEEEQEK